MAVFHPSTISNRARKCMHFILRVSELMSDRIVRKEESSVQKLSRMTLNWCMYEHTYRALLEMDTKDKRESSPNKKVL